jgi:hypothetical protein
MAQKIISIGLLLIGVLGIIVLLSYGGPVFPHIFGPTVVTAIGAFVFMYKKKVA